MHSHQNAVEGWRAVSRTRHSVHIEPIGLLQIARHYIRELIYSANDGIITTFAVVAGVAGGGLFLRVVLIIGAANLFAGGLSMAVGNGLSIRSHEACWKRRNCPTDANARTKFRRYWSFLSPGIIVIRWTVLGPVKKEAERRAREGGYALQAAAIREPR